MNNPPSTSGQPRHVTEPQVQQLQEMDDSPSCSTSGPSSLRTAEAIGGQCCKCEDLQKELEALQKKDLFYTTLQKKVTKTDALIKKYVAKSKECEEQEKKLQDLAYAYDTVSRNYNILEEELKKTIKETLPWKLSKDKFEAEMNAVRQKLEDTQLKVSASESLCQQYQQKIECNDQQEAEYLATTSDLKDQLRQSEERNRTLSQRLTKVKKNASRIRQELSRNQPRGGRPSKSDDTDFDEVTDEDIKADDSLTPKKSPVKYMPDETDEQGMDSSISLKSDSDIMSGGSEEKPRRKKGRKKSAVASNDKALTGNDNKPPDPNLLMSPQSAKLYGSFAKSSTLLTTITPERTNGSRSDEEKDEDVPNDGPVVLDDSDSDVDFGGGGGGLFDDDDIEAVELGLSADDKDESTEKGDAGEEGDDDDDDVVMVKASPQEGNDAEVAQTLRKGQQHIHNKSRNDNVPVTHESNALSSDHDVVMVTQSSGGGKGRSVNTMQHGKHSVPVEDEDDITSGGKPEEKSLDTETRYVGETHTKDSRVRGMETGKGSVFNISDDEVVAKDSGELNNDKQSISIDDMNNDMNVSPRGKRRISHFGGVSGGEERRKPLTETVNIDAVGKGMNSSEKNSRQVKCKRHSDTSGENHSGERRVIQHQKHISEEVMPEPSETGHHRVPSSDDDQKPVREQNMDVGGHTKPDVNSERKEMSQRECDSNRRTTDQNGTDDRASREEIGVTLVNKYSDERGSSNKGDSHSPMKEDKESPSHQMPGRDRKETRKPSSKAGDYTRSERSMTKQEKTAVGNVATCTAIDGREAESKEDKTSPGKEGDGIGVQMVNLGLEIKSTMLLGISDSEDGGSDNEIMAETTSSVSRMETGGIRKATFGNVQGSLGNDLQSSKDVKTGEKRDAASLKGVDDDTVGADDDGSDSCDEWVEELEAEGHEPLDEGPHDGDMEVHKSAETDDITRVSNLNSVGRVGNAVVSKEGSNVEDGIGEGGSGRLDEGTQNNEMEKGLTTKDNESLPKVVYQESSNGRKQNKSDLRKEGCNIAGIGDGEKDMSGEGIPSDAGIKLHEEDGMNEEIMERDDVVEENGEMSSKGKPKVKNKEKSSLQQTDKLSMRKIEETESSPRSVPSNTSEREEPKKQEKDAQKLVDSCGNLEAFKETVQKPAKDSTRITKIPTATSNEIFKKDICEGSSTDTSVTGSVAQSGPSKDSHKRITKGKALLLRKGGKASPVLRRSKTVGDEQLGGRRKPGAMSRHHSLPSRKDLGPMINSLLNSLPTITRVLSPIPASPHRGDRQREDEDDDEFSLQRTISPLSPPDASSFLPPFSTNETISPLPVTPVPPEDGRQTASPDGDPSGISRFHANLPVGAIIVRPQVGQSSRDDGGERGQRKRKKSSRNLQRELDHDGTADSPKKGKMEKRMLETLANNYVGDKEESNQNEEGFQRVTGDPSDPSDQIRRESKGKNIPGKQTKKWKVENGKDDLPAAVSGPTSGQVVDEGNPESTILNRTGTVEVFALGAPRRTGMKRHISKEGDGGETGRVGLEDSVPPAQNKRAKTTLEESNVGDKMENVDSISRHTAGTGVLEKYAAGLYREKTDPQMLTVLSQGANGSLESGNAVDTNPPVGGVQTSGQSLQMNLPQLRDDPEKSDREISQLEEDGDGIKASVSVGNKVSGEVEPTGKWQGIPDGLPLPRMYQSNLPEQSTDESSELEKGSAPEAAEAGDDEEGLLLNSLDIVEEDALNNNDNTPSKKVSLEETLESINRKAAATKIMNLITTYLEQNPVDLIPVQLAKVVTKNRSIKPVVSPGEEEIVAALVINNQEKAIVSLIHYLIELVLMRSYQDAEDCRHLKRLTFCRMIGALYRVRGSAGMFRVLCFDLVAMKVSRWPELILCLASVWPGPLTRSDQELEEQPFLMTLELIMWRVCMSHGGKPYKLPAIWDCMKFTCRWEDPIKNSEEAVANSLAKIISDEKRVQFLRDQVATSAIIPEYFESLKAMEMLAWFMGWRWTWFVAIKQIVWPILMKLSQDVCDRRELTAPLCLCLQFLSILGTVEYQSNWETHELTGAIAQFLTFAHSPKVIQVHTAHAILRLAVVQPALAVRCLKIWNAKDEMLMRGDKRALTDATKFCEDHQLETDSVLNPAGTSGPEEGYTNPQGYPRGGRGAFRTPRGRGGPASRMPGTASKLAGAAGPEEGCTNPPQLSRGGRGAYRTPRGRGGPASRKPGSAPKLAGTAGPPEISRGGRGAYRTPRGRTPRGRGRGRFRGGRRGRG